jgi:hypothetical protein
VGTVIRQVGINKNRITAIYLAQECLELARNVRDSAWQQNYPWDCGFGDNYTDSSRFIIAPQKLILLMPSSPDCQSDFGVRIQTATESNSTLFISDGGDQGQYSLGFTHDSTGTDFVQTPFKRVLTLSDIDNTKTQLTTTCTVTWDDEQISLSQVLTNWIKK